MKRPQLVSAGSISRMLQAAEQAWRQKDLEQCIQTLERASRLDPANFTVLLQLGRIQGLNHNYAAAEQCFEKAVRVAPRKAEALGLVAESCRDFRSPDLAERYFQRALEHKDVSAKTLARLAEHYERIRRAEEALPIVNRALQMDGDCSAALLVRARLDRQAGRLEEGENLLRRMLGKPDPGAQPGPERDTRIRGWYELGAILDRRKRFDEAMGAFLQAKSMLRLHAAQQLSELKIMRERLQAFRDSLTPEILRRWHDAGRELEPLRRLALLAGHPRSGTTLLEQVLDSHPDIVSSEETEIFHDVAYHPLLRGAPEGAPALSILDPAPLDVLRRSRADYFRSMELSLGQPVAGRLLIDKNPSYTFFVGHFIRLFPETRFLIALRDPRDVCLSCFMQSFVPVAQGNAGFLSLEGTVDEYVALMGMWRSLSPMVANPRLEVRYEDMVEDLESVSRRVLDFLSVPWDPGVLRFHEHARQKTVRSPTYADVARPVFKTAVGRWKSYERHLEPHLDKLAPFVQALGYD